MKAGALSKVSVETTEEAEEAVLEWLERICAVPATSCTEVETRVVRVSAFVDPAQGAVRPNRREIRAALERIRDCGLDIGMGRVSIRCLPRKDWAESWKRHFKPFEVGRTLLVKPSWSRRQPRSGQAVMTLDPGLSFGTGHHPTTAFCLEQLVRSRRAERPQSMLDIGCGSGILAIAAAKLGYAPVEGFDLDPDAVRIARENSRINNVDIRLYRADLVQLRQRNRIQQDLICANLTHDLLLEERSRILNRLRPGGWLVLAGILKSQFQAVQRAYEREGVHLVSARTGAEWRSGAFRKVS